MKELGCFGVKPLFQGRKRGAYMDVFTAFLRKNDPIPYPEFRLIKRLGNTKENWLPLPTSLLISKLESW